MSNKNLNVLKTFPLKSLRIRSGLKILFIVVIKHLLDSSEFNMAKNLDLIFCYIYIFLCISYLYYCILSIYFYIYHIYIFIHMYVSLLGKRAMFTAEES